MTYTLILRHFGRDTLWVGRNPQPDEVSTEYDISSFDPG
jgi:hypothetical protein